MAKCSLNGIGGERVNTMPVNLPTSLSSVVNTSKPNAWLILSLLHSIWALGAHLASSGSSLLHVWLSGGTLSASTSLWTDDHSRYEGFATMIIGQWHVSGETPSVTNSSMLRGAAPLRQNRVTGAQTVTYVIASCHAWPAQDMLCCLQQQQSTELDTSSVPTESI